MGNANQSIINTITNFTAYLMSNDVDTSLLSEWSPKRDAQLDSFMKFCYDNNFVPSDYNSQDNKTLLENPKRIQNLSFDESRKLLGYIIRSEYWGGGLYGKSIEDGSLIILLKRIAAHMSED